MSIFKKLLLSSLVISSGMGIGNLCANDQLDNDVTSEINGSFIVQGSVTLENQDSYTLTPGSTLTIDSNEATNEASLTSNKPFTLDNANSEETTILTLRSNAVANFNSGLTVNNGTIKIVKHDEKAPQLNCKSSLTLIGNVTLTGNSDEESLIHMQNDDTTQKAIVDVKDLNQVAKDDTDSYLLTIVATENTWLEYMTDEQKEQIASNQDVQTAVRNQLVKLANQYENNEDNSGLTFSGDNKPKVQDVNVGGAGSVNVEHKTDGSSGADYHEFKYSATSGAGFIANDDTLKTFILLPNDESYNNAVFELQAATEGTGANVSNFMSVLDSEQAYCETCKDYVSPNSKGSVFTDWVEDAKLPLYPSTAVEGFKNTFEFNMNIGDGGKDLMLNLGTAGLDTGNTPNHIDTLIFSGDNSAFVNTVKLFGNQLKNVEFGNINGLVAMDFTGVYVTEPITLSISDEVAQTNAFTLNKSLTLGEGQQLSFNTGAANKVVFAKIGETETAYNFEKFTFGRNSTVTVNKDVSLTI